MKKLGKKFSLLTKVLLVIGLLISNLSSLTVVFASEATEMVEVTLTDDTLNIKYLDELTEDVEMVNVNVYENYTYLDNTSEKEESNYSLSAEEFLSNGLSQLSILAGNDSDNLENIELFDGLYEVKVEITDLEGNEIDSAIYSKKFEYKSGLNVKLFDSNNTEIVALENGKYSVTEENSKVEVVAQVLSGGLKPTDMFVYEDQDYMAYEVVTELVFKTEMNFVGRLYGDYTVPVVAELLKPVASSIEVTDIQEEDLNSDVEPASVEYDEITYTSNLNVLYESYDMNADKLNDKVYEKNYEGSYFFYGEEKDGLLYVLLDLSEEPVSRTMLDLYNIVESTYGENEKITYVLSNEEYEDVIESYNSSITPETSVEETEEVVENTTELTLKEYLSEILLDDTAVLTVTNEGLTITYKVVVAGDLVNDNVLDKQDVLELINQVVAGKVENIEKADLFDMDGEVSTLDVMYLNQVVENADWYAGLFGTGEVSLNARLDVEEKDIYSGDEFTVEYVLALSEYDVNGVSGLFKYDKTVFELVSVEVENEWLGSNKDGKFLYLGGEKLTAPVVEENEETPEVEESTEASVEVQSEEEIVPTNEYVVVTATFKALKATSEETDSVITLDEIELFDDNAYLELDNATVSTDAVVVKASDNNKLSSLTVAGQTITLEENVYEYTITVTNDVTSADVVAELENVAANITSVVYPEKLAEGENTVIITVVSESGIEQVYTITVTREASEKEENTQVNYDNYYDDYEEEEEVVVTPEPEEEEEVIDTTEEEKDSNLSRIIIIILILLVIAGLIYLIFKDEDDDETKKANKEINKLKKEDKETVVKTTNKTSNKPENKNNSSTKNKTSNNKKKER